MRATLLLAILASCHVGDTLTGPDCTEQVDKTVDFTEPLDPAMHLKVESCRLDVDACNPLCSRALGDSPNQPTTVGDQQFFPTGFNVDKCDVSFEGATTHVAVTYTQFNSGPNCPVFEEGGAQP